MENNGELISFSKKQMKLINIAKLSRIVAWILICGYVLSLVVNIYSNIQANNFSLPINAFQFRFLIQFAINQLINSFTGIGLWLILIGISIGLRMIVEIDFNFHVVSNSSQSTDEIQKLTEEENPAVFYDPRHVIRLDGLLSKVAILSIFLIGLNIFNGYFIYLCQNCS